MSRYPLALSEAGTTIRQLIDITCALEGILLEPDLICNNRGSSRSPGEEDRSEARTDAHQTAASAR